MFPSIVWTAVITAITNIPVKGLTVNPIIIAGTAPIYGPRYGITFVTAQNNASTIAAGTFKINKPVNVHTKIINDE